MRSSVVGLFAALLVACSGSSSGTPSPTPLVDTGTPIEDTTVGTDVGTPLDEGTPDTSTPLDVTTTESGTITDLDGDGLDDAYEKKIAEEYLPYLSPDPDDKCPRAAAVYRLRPHPDAKTTRLHLTLVLLFEKDCGASGHVGDNEVFGVTIDPKVPAPKGILAVRAISHQNTACQEITNCGSCGGLAACTTAMRKGAAYPVVFYSKDKHGAYLVKDKCDRACFFTNFCTLSSAPYEPKMLNVGEPDKHLSENLTKSGLITAADGWTEKATLDYDPWGSADFGGAGKVSEDLVDPAFLTPACP